MSNQIIPKNAVQMFKIMLLSCCFALGAAASAAETKVTLSGASETPPVATMATGSGTITVNSDKTASGTVTTTGITGAVAHIHMGAEGKKGPVIIQLVKSGDNAWTVPIGSLLTDDQYRNYKAGNLYVNVHTAEHKDGEIRGQIKP